MEPAAKKRYLELIFLAIAVLIIIPYWILVDIRVNMPDTNRL